MVGLPLPPKRYATYEQRIAFSESVLERVKAIPGVQAAAIGNGGLPFGGPESDIFDRGASAGDLAAHARGADQRRVYADAGDSAARRARIGGSGGGARASTWR